MAANSQGTVDFGSGKSARATAPVDANGDPIVPPSGSQLPASLGQNGGLKTESVGGGALTNRSGTITAGATAQSMMSANAARRYLLIQNPTTGSESFWINFTTTAVQSQPSIEVAPGVTFIWEGTFIPTEAISVIASTTATPFIAKEG